MASYVHCPTCHRAFDVARPSGCPRCTPAAPPAPRLDRRVRGCLDELAAALTEASADELRELAVTLRHELAAAPAGPSAATEWRRALCAALARAAADEAGAEPEATGPVLADAPTALVPAPPVAPAGIPDERPDGRALAAALLVAVLSRLRPEAPAPSGPRRSVGRRALGLARRVFAALS